MARAVKEVALSTRAARSALKRRSKPYWRRVEHGVHIGFFKPATVGRPGSWIGRYYLGDQQYETKTIGLADDQPGVPADGERILTFDQAVGAVRAWGRKRREAVALAAKRAITVRQVVESYLAERRERDARTARLAEWRMAHHVLGAPLADLPLAALTEAALQDWRSGLRCGGRGARPDAALAASSVRRVMNDVRAALGAAARRERCGPEVLAAIRDGLRSPHGADRPRGKQVLTDDDVRRLVQAAYEVDEDFGDLLLTLAATGARASQIARVTVADLQADAARVMVPASRKGRAAKPRTHIALPLPGDVLAWLCRLAAGRAGHEPLLTRWRHRPAPGTTGRLRGWERADRASWEDVTMLTVPWRAALRMAELPLDLVPYSLRHTSIVRQLRAGLPVRLVATAHDTSVSMVERNYSAFITDATEDLLRRAVPPSLTPGNVAPLHGVG
jgi:integrase